MSYTLSQKAFAGTVVTLLVSILYLTYKELPVDYNGMAVFLSAAGAVYWGRSKTKADNAESNNT